jgi:hypothetical protein
MPPKFHTRVFGPLVEISLKLITKGEQPEDLSAVNWATGAWPFAKNVINSPARKGKSSFLFNG